MEPYLISQTGDRSIRPPRLPVWAGAFVVLVCVAMLALSAWHELDARSTTLHRSETEMANLARSLTQHAEDTIDLADATLVGLANRLEVTGTGASAIAAVQRFLDLRKETLGRIRGLFVYDENGRWLATTEAINP